MSRIQYVIDASKAVTTVNDFNNAVKSSGQVLGDFATKSVEVNRAGRITAGVIEQMDASGKKLTTTFNVIANALTQTGIQANTLSTKITEAGQKGAAAGQAFSVSWQGLVRILEVQLFRRAVTSVINAIRDGISAALQYQVQLQQVGNVTGQGGNLEAFGARVRALSDQFGVPISDTLAAAQVALTGQLGNSSAGFEVLTQSMRLSQATGVELAASNRLITTTLQAFNLEGSEAGRVANTFFLVAQRSRIPLDEMQAAIGRVSQTALGLDLSLEQVSALFLTISQQGGRPTEAFSLLNQVLGRLQQPTRELQDWLNSLGTPTANVAIQTFGLAGFLQKLNEAAAKTPERLGEIAGSVRTLRGLMAITGENVERFEENLRSLNTSNVALFDAQRSVQRTPAQQILTEFNKFKNTFEEDVGKTLINSVVKISNAFGGAEASAKGLISVIAQGVITFGLYKLSAEVIPGIMNNIASAQQNAATSTSNLTTNINAMTGGFTAGYVAGTLLFGLLEQIERSRATRIAAAGREQLDNTERAQARGQAQARDDLARSNELIQRAFAGRLQEAAQKRSLLDQQRQEEINNQKAIQDEFRVSSQTYLDTIRQRIASTRQAENQARADIIASRRSIENFQQQLEQRGFQRRIGVEQDPFGAIQLIENRARQLEARVRQVFNNPNATREQISAARATEQELTGLSDERFTRERQIQEEVARQNNNYREIVRHGVTYRVLQIDMSAAIARDNAQLQRRQELERIYQQSLEKTANTKAKEHAREVLNLRILDSLLRQQEQFKVTNDAGALLPRFRQAEDQRVGGGRTAALAEFEQIAQRMREVARQQGLELEPINALINQRRDALNREFQTLGAINTEERRRARLLEDQATTQTALAGRRAQEATQLTAIRALAGTAGQSLATLSGANVVTNLLPEPSRVASQGIVDLVRTFNQYKIAVDAAQLAQRRLTDNQSVQNVDALAEAMDRVRQRGTALQGVLRTAAPGAVAGRGLEGLLEPGALDRQITGFLEGTGSRSAQQIDRSVAEMRQLLTALGNTRGIIDSFETQLRQQAIANPVQAVQDGFGAAQGAANAAGPVMNQVLDDAANRASRLNDNLQNAVGQFRNLGQVGLGGGEAGFLAAGGIAGAFPGGPRGTDVLPYWLSPGEYIMDAFNTRKFYSQLVSMSHGQAPRYAASGGPVTTVGDINISVIGGSTSGPTIREIGRGLDREIRRGTIRLGKK